MCGIAGFFCTRENYVPDMEVQQDVLDSLKNRGPDGAGIWKQSGNKVLLLHRRLSIQDLSETGAQPMHSDDGSLVIVFNGEIYNVDELRKWVPTYTFKGTSDTEVILALYQKYGRQMLDFLRGMFALAIWDERNQGLFLARDPYGIKPLYLAETPDGVWFSSQVKSLLTVPRIDLSPEPAGHTGFFLWGSIPEPYTLYKGIRSLRSGHSLWLQKGSQPKYSQFSSIAKCLAESSLLPDGESAAARLQGALYESVKAHFVSDVPVGIFLSAGLDSSTILGIAASKFRPEGLTALTLGFDAYKNTPNDETVEAAQIAEYYGVQQQIRMVHGVDFETESTRFLQAMDQPSIDGANTYFVAKMAREAGFKVALSGIGGDELFGGYGSFRRIPQMMKVVNVLGLSRRFGGIIRRYSENLLTKVTSPKYAGVLEYGGTIDGAYLLRRGLFMPWELPDVLDADLAAAGLAELEQSQLEIDELKIVKEFPLHLQICFLESTRYMRNQLLRDADWAGMAHSLEIRTPLVDKFLLRQIAPLIRSNRAPTKLEMAGTPTRSLPVAILNRKKTGFGVPIREWISESITGKPERGLRSWAKFIYKNQWPGAQ
ncbi:MAG: asparagine synthase (glutamine-hydrolyzing) [Edaphobacter sp.]